MLLAFDIGNSHLYGGVIDNKTISLRFRFSTAQIGTSDQLGLFFRDVLRENQLEPSSIKHIAMSSVVPEVDYTVTAACIKYFGIEPFLVKAGIKTGMRLSIKNPLELGADRMTTAVAAAEHFPGENIVVVDLGTATTFCAISASKEYLGGAILPGIKTSMHALAAAAAKLSTVEILRPQTALGKTTEHNVQAGIYYGHLGAMRELISRLKHETFNQQALRIIATGGFAYLFEQEQLFDVIEPDLILQGLQVLYEKNQ
jgi:type III pantothenate kinase